MAAPAPRIVFQIEGKGRKHKFWEFKTQRAQIIGTKIDFYILFGGNHFCSPSQNCFSIAGKGKEPKFLDLKAQRTRIMQKLLAPSKIHTSFLSGNHFCSPRIVFRIGKEGSINCGTLNRRAQIKHKVLAPRWNPICTLRRAWKCSHIILHIISNGACCLLYFLCTNLFSDFLGYGLQLFCTTCISTLCYSLLIPAFVYFLGQSFRFSIIFNFR